MDPNVPSGLEVAAGFAVVPLIIGLTEAAKGSFLKDHDEYVPWFAVLLGLLASVGYALAGGTATGMQLVQAVMIGLGYGLSASGLYKGVGQPVINALKVKYADNIAPHKDADTAAKYGPYGTSFASHLAWKAQDDAYEDGIRAPRPADEPGTPFRKDH